MENKELLTGKTKIDFEQWYKQKYFLSVEGNCDSCGCGIGLPFEYDRLPQTMQQGVLLEYFREKEIWIQITCKYEWKVFIPEIITIEDDFYNVNCLQMSIDYSTALTHAIQKACEIYGKGE